MTANTDSRIPVFAPTPARGRIGRYELVERLATGGMAEIYLARETGGLDRLVVIKKILPHLAVHEQFVDMFLQEARIVSRLTHPNVVQIHELGEDKKTFFIAMEYVPGASLRELMRTAALSKIDVPVDVAISLICQACAGAHAAHELKSSDGKLVGLVHRDISPHNLMVTGDGHVKLLDFGIAKATEIAAEQTRTGALKGKVHYMSPEQCRQEALDRRSDVFALGIVLWELFTARRLFKRESDLASMQAIVTGDRWNPRDFRKDLPDEIADVLDMSLSTDRTERFASADGFRRALLDAAERAGLKISGDVIAPFVKEVLGERLEKMKQGLDDLDRTMSGDEMAAAGDATLVDRGRGGKDIHDLETELQGDAANATNDDKADNATNVTKLTNPAPLPQRRRPLRLLAAAAALAMMVAAGFFISRELGPTITGEPIVIGFAPTIDPALLRVDVEPLREWLELTTLRPVRVVIAGSYQDLADRLVSGKLQFASLPPNLFLETEKRSKDVDPIAFKLFNGASGSDGYLLVRTDAGVEAIADLRGKRFCYPDEKSTTGYKLPMRALRKAGLDPQRDLAQLIRSGNHTQVLRDLLAGKCDAGATYSGNYLSASDQGINVASLRLLAAIGRVPQDAITAGPGVSEADKALLQSALLAFDAKRDLGVDFVGRTEKITGFASGSENEFASLRRLLADDGRVKQQPVPNDSLPNKLPPPGPEGAAPDAADAGPPRSQR